MTTHRSRHRAAATWTGPVGTGSGVMQLGRGGPQIGYTVDARMQEEAGTNPEQLIGAAHAGCFAMSLTNLIEEAGIDGGTVEVRATAVVHLEQREDGFWISRIDLTARGTAPGLDAAQFAALAEQAKRTCPVSKLYSSAEITLDAALE